MKRREFMTVVASGVVASPATGEDAIRSKPATSMAARFAKVHNKALADVQAVQRTNPVEGPADMIARILSRHKEAMTLVLDGPVEAMPVFQESANILARALREDE